jgi:hypothetical protein
MTAFVLPAARINVDLVIAPATPNAPPVGNIVANSTKISWTDPTLNTDGTAIAAGEITSFAVGVRLATGTLGTYAYTASAPASAVSELLTLLAPILPTGVSLVAGVQVQSTANGNSGWTESSPFTLLATPNPVTNVVVS